MKDIDLEDTLVFMRMLTAFQAVEREISVYNRKNLENDSEHSYSLAILAWYLVNTYKLELDLNKVIRYALVHDIVEVYAGDTFVYTTDDKYRETKQQREREAMERLKREFPSFEDLHVYIERYEKQVDKEGTFICALDKIHPIIVIYLSGGGTWKKNKVSLSKLVNHKTPQVSGVPILAKFLETLCNRLKEEENKLFSVKGE